MTYINLGPLTKKNKILSLTLEKLASDLIFNELRNKSNLGYVAQANLKVFHYNLGLVILVQGEKFRPHQIE